MEINNDQFIALAQAIQRNQKMAAALLNVYAGAEVQKQAAATINAMVEKGVLQLDAEGKKAAVESLVSDPAVALKTLVKLADRAEKLQEKLIQADVGTPLGKSAGVEPGLESERVWQERMGSVLNSM